MAITMYDKIKRIVPAECSPIFYFYLKQVYYLILHRRTLENSTSMRSIDDSIKEGDCEHRFYSSSKMPTISNTSVA